MIVRHNMPSAGATSTHNPSAKRVWIAIVTYLRFPPEKVICSDTTS